jgi:hypothetical protein
MRRLSFLALMCFACSSDTGSTSPGPMTPMPVVPAPSATTVSDGGVRPPPVDAWILPMHGDAARAESGGCSVEQVMKCPSPKPSYKNDVIPILKARCYGCHSSTDGGGPWPLTTLVDIQDWKTLFIQDVQSCSMPPVDAGAKLTSEESATLLGWLVCGAPNN